MLTRLSPIRSGCIKEADEDGRPCIVRPDHFAAHKPVNSVSTAILVAEKEETLQIEMSVWTAPPIAHSIDDRMRGGALVHVEEVIYQQGFVPSK